MAEGAWIAAGQVVSTLAQLVGIRILTGMLAAETYGYISLLIGASTLLVTTFCGPFFKAVARFYVDARNPEDLACLRSSTSAILVKMTTAITVLVLLGGGIYLRFRPGSILEFLVLVTLVVADVIRTFEVSLLSAARRQTAAAIWSAADAIARPLFAIVFAWSSWGPSPLAVLSGYGTGAVLALGIGAIAIQREGAGVRNIPNGSRSRTLERELWKYSIPMVPSAIVSWITGLSDRYIIGSLLGLEKAGLYVAGYGLVSRPFLMVGTIIMTAIRPVYFAAVANGNVQLQQKTLRSWLVGTFGVCALGYLAVLLCSDLITRLALSSSYRSTSGYLHWISMGYCFACMSYVFNTVSLAHKNSWPVLLSEAGGAVSCIAISIPLTWKYGLEGAAVSVPSYFFVQCAIAWALAWPLILQKGREDKFGTRIGRG